MPNTFSDWRRPHSCERRRLYLKSTKCVDHVCKPCPSNPQTSVDLTGTTAGRVDHKVTVTPSPGGFLLG